jgi:threonine dehydrogenase-like Zn-dependent dehydrogenase
MGMKDLPDTQYAVQLVGPGQVRLNKDKPVHRPGPHQILARVECVGLCFSDLKLLKQFSQHVRKGEIIAGLPADVLEQIPSYVPGERPTVPGHEVTCRIVAAGDHVKHHRVGERVLVQADFRDLRTANSNGAFGYNFEGALQEYVLMDERVVIDKRGERLLVPVPEELSASAIALVEPWACVENSYVNPERRTLKPGGRTLIVREDSSADFNSLGLPLAKEGGPPQVLSIGPQAAAAQPDEAFDDIIYLGADKRTIETLDDKLAPGGIINIVLGGRKIGQSVSVGIGRLHYGATRWIGTTSGDATESYTHIPATGELRPRDKVAVVGAGGPMGQMHVIRAICSGVPGIEVVCTDVDDARLDSLARKAAPLAKTNGVALRTFNASKGTPTQKFSYVAIMAPVGALLADAVLNSLPGCLINVFAGIPAATRQHLDLDTYIANNCHMFGTSGSVIRDIRIVLAKVEAGRLDTNRSVDAVCGMAGALDGLAAVENRTLAGKIVVYPVLHDVGLIRLAQMEKHFPTVATKLVSNSWTRAAEDELLRVASAASE